MKAAYYETTGAPDVIRYGDLPTPSPKEGEVLVRVGVAALNPIDAYIRSTRLEPLTPRTITDPEQLRERLATIRREGFAISLGETVPGAAGIAAPIFNADGSVTAGLLIGAPLDRFEQELPELKRLLREAITRVSGIAQALVEEKGAARD